MNLVSLKIETKLINDQFKNIKNNINDELNNMIDEEISEDDIEDEYQINEMNKFYVGNHIKSFRNENDKRNSIHLIKNKLESDIIDHSDIEVELKNGNDGLKNKDGKDPYLIENEFIIKFNSDQTTKTKINIPKIKFDKPFFSNVVTEDTNDNIYIAKNQPNQNICQNCQESEKKTETNSVNFSIFSNKIKRLCETSSKMIKWMEQSYKWIENRYLKEKIKMERPTKLTEK